MNDKQSTTDKSPWCFSVGDVCLPENYFFRFTNAYP